MKRTCGTSAKCLALFLCLLFLLSASAAEQSAGDPLASFSVRHGSRDSKKIAITMDDIYEPEYVWKSVALCRQYGIAMTFFPIGINILEEDGAGWRDVVDAGCEIGSHSLNHLEFYGITEHEALARLGRFQQFLDRALGYHYQVRWFRPPFGTIKAGAEEGKSIPRAIRKFGYEHILLWDVSETNAKKALRRVQNGSILLYHARKKDYACLEALIPQLLEAGFEPVTVSELFGFDPPAVSEELYIFDEYNFIPPQ